MRVTIRPSWIKGHTLVPPSKSHTIRAIVAATLAEGRSIIRNPLRSRDIESTLGACSILGAQIKQTATQIEIRGCAGHPVPTANKIDVANSGTTLRLCTAVATLSNRSLTLTGDSQTQKRPMEPLLTALHDLGASCQSHHGYPPVTVCGPLQGGETTIHCETSQYLSALLLAAPLAPHNSHISVPLLNEHPYVEMTLEWLRRLKINYQQQGLQSFSIAGNQRYRAFEYSITGDWSSATFLLCAAAICRSKIVIDNLDSDDSQGDRQVIAILQDMGYYITVVKGKVNIDATPGPNQNQELAFDLNQIPDALPALAATACYGRAPIRLFNIAHARIKESDRIACMKRELSKMGARIDEGPAELRIIPPATMQGAELQGHHDHRVVMALTIAALGAQSPSSISDAEDAAITFPDFFTTLSRLSQQQITPYE